MIKINIVWLIMKLKFNLVLIQINLDSLFFTQHLLWLEFKKSFVAIIIKIAII